MGACYSYCHSSCWLKSLMHRLLCYYKQELSQYQITGGAAIKTAHSFLTKTFRQDRTKGRKFVLQCRPLSLASTGSCRLGRRFVLPCRSLSLAHLRSSRPSAACAELKPIVSHSCPRPDMG
jgi:hypothetical protein